MKLKQTTFSALLLLLVLQSVAQVSPRNGYIGISIGPSIPIGEFNDEALANTGVNLSLVNFGYLFNGRFGIAANWFGGAHLIDGSPFGLSDGMWSYGGLIAGPLISNRVGNQLDLDVKLQIGFSAADMELEGYHVDGTGFAYSFGIGIRTHLSQRLSLSVNADMLTFNAKGDYMQRKIQTIHPTMGLNYRFR